MRRLTLLAASLDFWNLGQSRLHHDISPGTEALRPSCITSVHGSETALITGTGSLMSSVQTIRGRASPSGMTAGRGVNRGLTADVRRRHNAHHLRDGMVVNKCDAPAWCGTGLEHNATFYAGTSRP
jgi:hypothetical protein